MKNILQGPVSQKGVNSGRKLGRLTKLRQNLDRPKSRFTKERIAGRKLESLVQTLSMRNTYMILVLRLF